VKTKASVPTISLPKGAQAANLLVNTMDVLLPAHL